MSPFSWDFQYESIACCLTCAGAISLRARSLSVDDRIGRWLKNWGHGVALGYMADTALGLMSKNLFNPSKVFVCFIFIPIALATTTCGISYLARKKNYQVAEQLEALDKNMGKWMDIATIIFSIAGTLLLASRASKAPLNFAFTAAISGLNFLHAYFSYNRVPDASQISLDDHQR